MNYFFNDMIFNKSSDNWTIWIPPILTFIGVLFTLLMSFYNNKRNNEILESLKQKEIHANIVRKSMVKWLDDVRNNTANFAEKYYAYINENLLCESITLLKQKQNEYNKEYWLLKLYFTTKNGEQDGDSNHIELSDALDECDECIKDFVERRKENKNFEDIEYLDQAIEEFMDLCSNYFKQVWEDTKKEIDEKEINEKEIDEKEDDNTNTH